MSSLESAANSNVTFRAHLCISRTRTVLYMMSGKKATQANILSFFGAKKKNETPVNEHPRASEPEPPLVANDEFSA